MGADNEVEEISEKLMMIAFQITDKDFSNKPVYAKIRTHNLLDDNSFHVLEHLSKITKCYIVSPIEVLYKQKYELEHKISNGKEKCPICQCEFYEEEIEEYEKYPDNLEYFRNIVFNVVLIEKCEDHFFHLECIGHLIGDKDSFKCPICSRIYGTLIGDMPDGTFKAYKQSSPKCMGYENYDTIVIYYNIPSGYGFSGTSRTSYLPNNKEGREVLALLKVAFDRKLTFTVGTSVTTGLKNTVVWNGIHHKTNVSGGPTRFGYPDNTYFNRVKEELASKGVTQESIGRDLESIAKEILHD
jgi:deltex-like protein